MGELILNADPFVRYIPLPIILTSDEVNSLVATIPASRSPSILSAVTVVLVSKDVGLGLIKPNLPVFEKHLPHQ